jgi:hypothetical protein
VGRDGALSVGMLLNVHAVRRGWWSATVRFGGSGTVSNGRMVNVREVLWCNYLGRFESG